MTRTISEDGSDQAAQDQASQTFSGYEADSLIPFAAFLGIGFAIALLYAAGRAYRRQHRGLSLASMAAGLAVTLYTLAWILDIPGAAERGSDVSSDAGVWLGLLGASLWALGSGLLAKEPEGDPEHGTVVRNDDSANQR